MTEPNASAGRDNDVFRDRLVSRVPVTVRRRVMWGECDPAQVVYTPRFSDYVASAADWFWDSLMQDHSPGLSASGVFAPVKHLSFTFHKVLRPNDVFDMVVHVTAIRIRSLDLSIEAAGQDGAAHFSATLSPIFVSASDYVAVPIPDHIRVALEVYRRAG